MPHAIDLSTGRAAVFVTKEPAWHQLGRVVSDAVTSQEAIELAGLEWEVEQWPLIACSPGPQLTDRKTLLVKDRVANVRIDTQAVLGVVGTDYRVLQNKEAFAFMDELVGEKLAMFETAGALKGGKRIWMLARIPKEIRPAGTDDVIEPYVLLANSHDGTMAVRMIPTTVRVVCQNTLNLALNKAGTSGLRVAHFENLHQRIEEARQQLGIVVQRFDRFQEELDALTRVSLTEAQVKDYWRDVMKIEPPEAPAITQATQPESNGNALDDIINRMEQRETLTKEFHRFNQDQVDRKQASDRRLLEQLLENYDNPTNTMSGVRGTAWAAFNSVSQFVDHQGRNHGRSDAERADNRLSSIWFGNGDRVKQTAYNAALQLATSS